MESNLKLVGHAFIQKRKKKYSEYIGLKKCQKADRINGYILILERVLWGATPHGAREASSSPDRTGVRTQYVDGVNTPCHVLISTPSPLRSDRRTDGRYLKKKVQTKMGIFTRKHDKNPMFQMDV